jgi:hypothetical protein
MEDEMKKPLGVTLSAALIGIGITSSVLAQNASTQSQTQTQRAKPDIAERHSVRKEFEAIFAKGIADYKAQFESVKRGEKLKPNCAPEFVLKRTDGTTMTCEQITAERQAKFERIRRINLLVIEIGNIEIAGNDAIVYTTQRFSRVVPDENGKEHTVFTDGTVHKEFWVRTERGWESRGFEEVKQGPVTVN